MPHLRQHPRILDVRPSWAVEGGRVTVTGDGLPVDEGRLPEVRVGDQLARVVHASPSRLSLLVPSGLPGGRTPVRVEGTPGETAFIEVGRSLARGLHQVDSPIFDRHGNLYVTYSGHRGEQVPVSIFRVRPDGVRESFATDIVNPTSMALDRRGQLFVSSRFEGKVCRLGPDGSVETYASELGVPCGLAFGADGELYVGDRSGTIFRVRSPGQVEAFASLSPSVAAFHLAMGPDGWLYVTAPTLASRDSVYRISLDRKVEVFYSGFGRPQGLAFDALGHLYVVDALVGEAGLYRLRDDGRAEQVLAAPELVGLAFDPAGGLVVASNEAAYRLQVNVRGTLPMVS